MFPPMCCVGDAGATVLASAARRCPSLSHLHLQGNIHVSTTALKLITTALSSAKRRRRNSTTGLFDTTPGSTNATQAVQLGAGEVESSAAALEFQTRSRFASVSCEREPETVSSQERRNRSSAAVCLHARTHRQNPCHPQCDFEMRHFPSHYFCP